MRFPPPNPIKPGWWKDPLHTDDLALRYHDGTNWTDYICLVGWRFKGPIQYSPMPRSEDT